MLITRGFRHVLQDIEPAADCPLAIRRKLAPLRQYIILDVILLLGCQPVPVFQAPLYSLLFRRGPSLKVPVIFNRSLPFLRVQVVEVPRLLRIGRRPVQILLISRSFRRTIHVRNDRLVLRRPIRIARRACSLLVPTRMLVLPLLPLFLPLLLLFLSRLVLRRTIL